MSYLSLLFASKAPSTSPAAWEIHHPLSEIRNEERSFGFAAQRDEEGPVDAILPSGIRSMEHWLDLNA
jgi:hypothetical protein